MFQENILEYFKNFEVDDGANKRSKKSMTRMKRMENHIKVRFPNFDYDQIVQDEDDQDQIEIDIDSQRIMVTRDTQGNK